MRACSESREEETRWKGEYCTHSQQTHEGVQEVKGAGGLRMNLLTLHICHTISLLGTYRAERRWECQFSCFLARNYTQSPSLWLILHADGQTAWKGKSYLGRGHRGWVKNSVISKNKTKKVKWEKQYTFQQWHFKDNPWRILYLNMFLLNVMWCWPLTLQYIL